MDSRALKDCCQATEQEKRELYAKVFSKSRNSNSNPQYPHGNPRQPSVNQVTTTNDTNSAGRDPVKNASTTSAIKIKGADAACNIRARFGPTWHVKWQQA
jgi:hypothetical protein